MTNEIRVSPLTGFETIVAPNRAKRPVDPGNCPFCLPSPEIDPALGPQVVRNMYPALSPEFPEARGYSEILIESLRHDTDIHLMPEGELLRAFDTGHRRMRELFGMEGIEYVHLFRNRPKRGGTLSHPHSQIYALPFVPAIVRREAERFSGSCPLCTDPAPHHAERVVASSETVAVLLPYAPRAPYEVHVYPPHARTLWAIDAAVLRDTLSAIRRVILALDSVFGETAYTLCEHNAPKDTRDFHAHFELIPQFHSQRQVRFSTGLEHSSGVYLLDASVEDMANVLRAAFDRT